MNPALDRLARAKARPLLVEDAVRVALRDAVAWRIGGGAAPGVEAFAAAAVAAGRQALDELSADTHERSHALGAAAQTARRFCASPLGRRLMTMPASQFVRLPAGPDRPDVIVRDRHRRVHAIVLRLRTHALEAGRIATAIAAATPLSVGDRLSPLTIHVCCLRTGKRHAFERDVSALRTTRVA